MRSLCPILLIALFASPVLFAAETQEESELKFAIYSRAWGANTNDGLRLVANNQTDQPVLLQSIAFLKNGDTGSQLQLDLNLEVPAGGYAETDLDYLNLLDNNECVDRTLADNWKLAEISNYTLNPSVRGLIIEDTDSFRIYQCVETVLTTWTDLDTDISYQKEEWILYHFESRSN